MPVLAVLVVVCSDNAQQPPTPASPLVGSANAAPRPAMQAAPTVALARKSFIFTDVPTAHPSVSLTEKPLTPTRVPIATASRMLTATPSHSPTATSTPTATPLHPLAIEAMRGRAYPGSDVTIEQTLSPGPNYERYIASYQSDGLKIYALLTVPAGQKPASGWPVIIFNHGYIPPAQYRTTERYVAYVDAFARNGYIVFRPDYRGHGNSEGQPSSAYGSPDYTVDVLNAVASMKRYQDADPDRIGMWGHSMGGHLTLRAMVTTKDVKAGVIWAGVVTSYPGLLNRWRTRRSAAPALPSYARRWRDDLIAQYGAPEDNPEFWASISPNTYLSDLSGPVQLHHGTADESVPLEFSQKLHEQIQEAGRTVEFYTYEGDNHNLSNSFQLAIQRSLAFFDRYVKGR